MEMVEIAQSTGQRGKEFTPLMGKWMEIDGVQYISTCFNLFQIISLQHISTYFRFFLPKYLDSPIWDIYLQSEKEGAIAQSVEQWTENPCVPGSIPGGTTSLKHKTRKINVLRVFALELVTELMTDFI